MPHDLNAANIAKLLAREASDDDTVTILYIGDSQGYYASLQKLVSKANTLDGIDFMVLCGDITDYGTLQEYLWIEKETSKLKFPYICAIGNHDLTSNGEEIYESMYGKKDFSFLYKKYKFVIHNTNSREYGFNGSVPDIQWLETELEDNSASWFVGVSHVPPYSEDFDKKLEQPYKNTFAAHENFLLSLHGHIHDTSDSYYYKDHVRYMTAHSVIKNEAVIVKLIHGKILKTFLTY